MFIKCSECGRVVGAVGRSEKSISTALPLQYRGLLSLLPKEVNLLQALVDVLEVKCPTCYSLSLRSENVKGKG